MFQLVPGQKLEYHAIRFGSLPTIRRPMHLDSEFKRMRECERRWWNIQIQLLFCKATQASFSVEAYEMSLLLSRGHTDQANKHLQNLGSRQGCGHVTFFHKGLVDCLNEGLM